MTQYKMVVLSNPVSGREKECDDWYQNQHLYDVVKIPGFISAQRFQLANSIAQAKPYHFMAVYEIDSEDLERTLSGLVKAAETGELEISSALDRANSYAVVYAADGGPVTQLKATEA